MWTVADELEHVARPNLPWRDERVTECGRPTEGHTVITRDELTEKIRKQGKMRAGLSTCMTCATTAPRWADWPTAPSEVMRRHVPQWHGAQGTEATRRLDAELRAIAALIEAHRDEFDGYLAGLAETSSLADRRAQRRARR